MIIAKNSIMGQISNLPVHMSIMNNTLTTDGEFVVIREVLNPTLLTADATSKRACETF